MKRIRPILYLLLLAGSAVAQRPDTAFLFSYFKDNGEDGLHLAYSQDGYQWQALKNDISFLKPTVSKDRLMRDPCIIKGPDNQFHMVWTVSWNAKGIGYATSSDLIHWSAQQYIPVMEHEPGARNCWAPEIFYDAQQKAYMIFWATTITGRFPETQRTEENAYNHRIYFVTTKDFKTFSAAKLLYEPGFNVIDATILKDRGQYVMFLKDETRNPPQKNIRIATSKKLTGPYGKPSAPVTGQYWAEGPTVARTDRQWIVYFDKYTQHRMGAVVSNDLVIWTDVSEQVRFPLGTRHGTVLKVSSAELAKLR